MFTKMVLVVVLLFSVMADAAEPPTVQQLREKPELLNQLYEPAPSLTVQEYFFRGYIEPGQPLPLPMEVPPEYFSEDLYVVQDGAETLYIKKHAFRNIKQREFVQAGEEVLCLPNPSGGNGWNANPWFVIATKPPALLGQVSGVGDPDQDNQNDLVVVEDVWESGWPQLSHAGAPQAAIFIRVDQHRLIPDESRNSTYAQTRIYATNDLIKSMQPEAAKAFAEGKPADPALFSAVLQKFLYHRVWGQNDLGWQEFRKDLRLFDQEVFPVARFVAGQGELPSTPIKDIEDYAEKSLAKRGDLKTWLTSYMSLP